jgi:predicted MFS family arabinose efflux permease
MTGLVSGGISFGTLVLPPVVTHLVDSLGWRWTYVVLGGVVLVVIPVAAQFLRHSPQQSGLQPFGESGKGSERTTNSLDFSWQAALRTPQFWMVAGIYLCFGFTQLTVMVHIIPDAVGLNIPPLAAAAILSVIGAVSLGGRLIVGAVADRIRGKNAAIICLCLIILALIWLQFSTRLWQMYFFAVVFGFGYGGLSCLQSLISAELFGLSALGVITAIFSFGFNIGGSAGPVLAGYIFDLSASYRWAFVLCLALMLVAFALALKLRPPRRKRDA